ncbi:MAG: hypothetical protein H6711_26925 [Myxococcales bacterium]|nr:hypothetical protein [Myxococcales bacterium]
MPTLMTSISSSRPAAAPSRLTRVLGLQSQRTAAPERVLEARRTIFGQARGDVHSGPGWAVAPSSSDCEGPARVPVIAREVRRLRLLLAALGPNART